MLKYLKITSREDFAYLLGIGFGYLCSDPWTKYDEMSAKYGDRACIDISYSNKFITYAPEEYLIDIGYICGTILDVVSDKKSNVKRK